MLWIVIHGSSLDALQSYAASQAGRTIFSKDLRFTTHDLKKNSYSLVLVFNFSFFIYLFYLDIEHTVLTQRPGQLVVLPAGAMHSRIYRVCAPVDELLWYADAFYTGTRLQCRLQCARATV